MCNKGESFALETALSGLGYLQHIEQWRLLGYRVSLFFLSLPDAETAIARVAERVRQGGHDIPEPVIRRRFTAGKRNFIQRYRNQVSDWALYDNAGNIAYIAGMGRKHMNKPDISQARNPDLRASLTALQRAAEMARQTAIQTNTAIVLIQDGKLVKITAQQLREMACMERSSNA